MISLFLYSNILEHKKYGTGYGILSSVRHFYFPPCDGVLLTDVFYALSDPIRLRIVAALADGGEQCCASGSLASVPKSTLAHHYKVLRETGIITTRIEGTQSVNSLRRADLNSRFPGLLDAVLQAIVHCPLMAPCSEQDK